jgi:hypothetical protein
MRLVGKTITVLLIMILTIASMAMAHDPRQGEQGT